MPFPNLRHIPFVSPPHLLTHSALCPDLPTHLCLPVCESPSLSHLLPVLTCPPICDFQFVSPPHLLCVLTYPPICAIQFMTPPFAPHSDLPTHLCYPFCESPSLAHLFRSMS